MVVRVDVELSGSKRPRQGALGGDVDGVGVSRAFRELPVLDAAAEALGEVLEERSAARDVEGLRSTRDREHRQVRRNRLARQGELGCIQIAPCRAKLGVG